MLQQTRVATVLPFYERFLARFPAAPDLAAASDEQILGAWAGLGYYRRVRLMREAARGVGAAFPSTYEGIRALPGIGDYTAAAVASIAFDLPHAAVDGNVLRVASRLSDEAGDIASTVVKARLTRFVTTLLDKNHPGEFNQAMMELGATICVPREPQCLACPVERWCEARASGRQNELPVKSGRAATVRIRRRLYAIERDGSVLLWQRDTSAQRLAGFWELPEREQLGCTPRAVVVGEFRHSITHHEYTVEVATVRTLSRACKNVVNCRWIARNLLENMALSTTARKALRVYDASRAR